VNLYILCQVSLPTMNMHLICKKTIIFFFIASIAIPLSLSATSSVDYTVESESITTAGPEKSTSTNVIIDCQQVGEIAIGNSIDSNGNLIEHGLPCFIIQDVILNFTFLPQGRFGIAQTNDQSRVTIEVRQVGAFAASFIFSEEVTTLSDGTYTGLALIGVPAGIYDVTAKGWATLRTKKTSINLNSGLNNIDFSDAGLTQVPSGDVDITDRSGAGSSEKGDNEISAGDYSVLVANYNASGPLYDRIDLDQYDLGASAADYSILVGNYNLSGAI